MKRNHVITGAGLAMLVAGGVYFWRANEKTPAATRTNKRPPIATTIPARAVAAIPSPQTLPAGREAPCILSSEEFDHKFSLSGVTRLKFRNAVFAIASNLKEMKGLYARITSFDGKTLKMEVPALQLPDQVLEDVVMDLLASATNEEKANAIWNDPDGRQTLLDQIAYSRIIHSTPYEFVKVKPEDNPAANGSLGYARFDVTWSYTGEGGGPGLSRQMFKGFTFADENNIGLSWNAMSKAPQGYFRSEPIKEGEASRGTRSPIVIEDLESGEIEVLNARYLGSHDRIPRN